MHQHLGLQEIRFITKFEWMKYGTMILVQESNPTVFWLIKSPHSLLRNHDE